MGLKDFLNKVWEVYIEEYKKVMLIAGIIIFFLSLPLFYTKITKGYFIDTDYSIKGGTLISVKVNKTYDTRSIEDFFKKYFPDVSVREKRDKISGRIIGYDIVTSEMVERERVEEMVKKYFGEVEFSVLYQSPALGREFFIQATYILIFSILMMGLLVYYYFRNLASTLSIMFTTTMDLILTLSFMNVLGLKLSIASFGALLMILGYSVDSDVLLSTMVVKREGDIKENVWFAFKVELVMNAAAFLAFLVMIYLSHVDIIKKIAEVLLLGLIFDFITTWGFGYSLQRMLVRKK